MEYLTSGLVALSFSLRLVLPPCSSERSSSQTLWGWTYLQPSHWQMFRHCHHPEESWVKDFSGMGLSHREGMRPWKRRGGGDEDDNGEPVSNIVAANHWQRR